MLTFEHLIIINDPSQPQLPTLSHEQLWRAVLMRAKFPQRFNAHIVDAQLSDVSKLGWQRRLVFAGAEIQDRVTLVADTEVHVRALPTVTEPFSMNTRIEQPSPGTLVLRFRYARQAPAQSAAVDIASHLQSAYVAADREAVAQMRQFAATHQLLSVTELLKP